MIPLLSHFQYNPSAYTFSRSHIHTHFSKFCRSILDLAHVVRCNSVGLFNSTFLVGSGAPFSVFSAWGSFYSTTDLKIKFYTSSSPVAKGDVANCM